MKVLKKLSVATFMLVALLTCFYTSTLTAQAFTKYNCSVCGCTPFRPSSYDSAVCGVCGHSHSLIYPNTHTHTYPNTGTYSAYVWQDATYHVRTYTQTCSCGDVKNTTQKAGHSWANRNPMQYQQIAGNASQHQYKQYCTVCNGERRVNTSHSYQWTNEYRSTSATQHQRKQVCSQCGYVKWVSQNCGFSNYNPMVYQEISGNINQHEYKQHCNYCTNTKWITQSHNWRAQKDQTPTGLVPGTKEYVDALVAGKAYRYLNETQCEHKYACTSCNAVKWVKESHSWSTSADKISLNETQHYQNATCTKCGFLKQTSIANHTFKSEVIGGADGHSTVSRCSACGFQKQSTTEAHTFGAWSYTTKNGVKTGTRTCSVCKYIDQTVEIVGVPVGIENAIVLSDAMTIDEIIANARTGVSSPAWKAAIGTGSNFNTASARSSNYVWNYGGLAYGLSERPDGLYYIVQLPTYYYSRIHSNNPNSYNGGRPSGSYSGGGSSTENNYYDPSKPLTSGPEQPPTGFENEGTYNQNYNDLLSQMGDAFNSNTGEFDWSKIETSNGYGMKDTPDTSKGEYKNEFGMVVDKTGMPVFEKTTYDPPVHYCSWSTSYEDLNATHHTKIRVSCCSGPNRSTEPHNYGNWTYTDLGPELHRGERVCKQCGHVDTKIEAHKDNNNDHRCDQCTRVISVVITWHWYDEHTPVTDTTVQRYYRGLVHPPLRGRQDYKFTGWYTVWGGENNGGEEWPQGRDYPYSSPTHLYASWEAILERVDVVAPIITVTRNPADINTPVGEVSLTITAVDPQGNDHDLPLQIEGDTEWHPSPWTITVDKSKQITIVARDTEGNVREFVVDVNNVDTLPPAIVGLSSNVKGWTKNPVTITATVHDDQKLAALPYQWEFTPNSTGTASLGQWTSVNTLSVAEAGKVRVQVRDTVGNAVWSDYFEVNNIDTIAPQLSTESPYTLDTTEMVPADRGVTITLNIRDIPDPVTGLSSGLSPDPIKWQDETVFGKNKSKTVYANGVYEVTLVDAVGNTSIQRITINNISTENPTVNNFYAISEDGKTITGSASTGEWFRAPYTLVVDASFGVAGPADKPYSWDGGKTWTSLNTHEVTTNGEYTVLIKDAVGTIVEQSITLDNTDATKPTVGMYLFKGLPEDWTDPNFIERDYVWKMRIEAEDLGSGLKDIHTQWDDKHYTDADLPIVFDVKTPGTYHVTVTDNAGNVTQAEKVAQWTDLGENVDGPNPNVPVVSPEPGTGGAAPNGTGSDIGSGLGPNGQDWGTAGYPYNANLEDLVFGPEGAYNTVTGEYTPYPPDMKGIPVNFNAHVTRNKWATAYVTFNGTKYPATFAPVPTPFNTSYSNGISPVKGTGDPLAGHAFIPISAITSDVKNARITVTVMEWNDQSCIGEPNRVGTENFYTSAQISKPVISYVYNQVTEELSIAATSAIAGVNKIEYSLDGGTTWHDYDGTPVVLTGLVSDGDTIVMKATDTLGNSTTLTVPVTDLGLNGGAGGGSLPAEDTADNPLIGADGNAVNSHHSSNRAADIYIIGGTRSNTTQVPGTQVFQWLLPTPANNP